LLGYDETPRGIHLGYLDVGDGPDCGTISDKPITSPLILIPAVLLAVKFLIIGRIYNVKFVRTDPNDRP
jgi:hypothetical protein